MRRYICCIFLCLFVWVAMPVFAQDDVTVSIKTPGPTLLDISKRYNVCVHDLRVANPELADYPAFAATIVNKITIPHVPHCYKEIVVSDNETLLLEILKKQAPQLCEEALYLYNETQFLENRIDFYASQLKGTRIYIPIRDPDCFNSEGQRLRYFGNQSFDFRLNESSYELNNTIYTVTVGDIEAIQAIGSPEEVYFPTIEDLLEYKQWCSFDIYPHNPFLRLLRTPRLGIPYRTYIFEGLDIFLPDTMHSCKSIDAKMGQTFFELSRDYNFCVEDAIPTFQEGRAAYYPVSADTKIEIPADAPPCYDFAGQRLGRHDKAVYHRKDLESLYDVAVMYNVCVSDLLDANPFRSRYLLIVPLELFIPDTPPCTDNEAQAKYTIRAGDTLQTLSLLYNVCANRIVEINDPIQYQDVTMTGVLDPLAIDTVLLIPTNRPDCYELGKWGTPQLITYICYPEVLDLTRDYAGHMPPMSPLNNTNSDYCYGYGQLYNVAVYNNEKLMVYQQQGYDTGLTIAQCFDVSLDALAEANAKMYPSEVRGQNEWIILEPYNHDCFLLTADAKTYEQKYRELWNRAGYLDENGIYTVNFQDTLSEIGRRFGYLPQWIAEHNQLESPDLLYIGQGLKLPPYPSLYDMAKIGVAIGGMVAIPFVLRMLYRWRTGGKRKRKNEDKTKVS